MILILLCPFVSLVSAQYENQPLTFQPIPVILQLPENGQHHLANMRYSAVDSAKNERNADGATDNHAIRWSSNLRRYDDSHQVPQKMIYSEDRVRNSRYQDKQDDYYLRRPEKTSRGRQISRTPDRRSKRQRFSRKDALSVHRNILRDERAPAEGRRNPRIIKYIADKNGVAVREDIVQSFQHSPARSKKSRGSGSRILTAASSPLLSHVVTSAIRVSNHQPTSGGKYVPQIIDLKVGDI